MPSIHYTYIQVAIPLPVNDPFTYKIDAALWNDSYKGARILIPFTNRTIMGYCIERLDDEKIENPAKIKEAISLIDRKPLLNAKMLSLTKKISEYYFCSWGEAIENSLPGLLKQKKVPIEEVIKRKSKREKLPDVAIRETLILTPEQKRSLERIERLLEKETFERVLLFGVTGSGKTEIYIRAIKNVLARKKTAICLVPEIALTKHLESYFLSHFGEQLALFHSRMTPQEKFLIWKDIYEGKKSVVLGPRSALFAPLENIGIIIVDEEHENTYKQNETPRYHAREVAAMRAAGEQALLIYGGATPSIETMYETRTANVSLIRLERRVVDRPLPEVRVVDMKYEVRNDKISLISQFLKDLIEKKLEAKEGIILFLNRRGFATSITCYKCGTTVECPICRLPLTYHQAEKKLLCHYCAFTMNPPEQCPSCKNPKIHYGGLGTERIESYIAKLFPLARIERFDTDRVRKKGEHEKIIHDFYHKKIDILIGTQMITKGFDFPHVTLVGIINADTMLALPDFRSTERTFQLLTQVAGRAGRGDKKGIVVIQTFLPSHYAIQTAAKHDFISLYEQEIKRREELSYPPYSRLINIIIRGRDENKVREYAQSTKVVLENALKDWKLDMLGPAPLPFYHLKGYFRWHIMLKGNNLSQLNNEIRAAFSTIKRSANCQIAIDVDPVNIL
jgi:primosomal protein N' (replication factor Y) (superfamily II helicase)